MFTGIIQEIGIITRIKEGRGREFTIKANRIVQDMHYGDSISVNGTCQTVTQFDHNNFSFFSMKETLELTNLSRLKVGSRVNLEPSLTLNSLLGGHLIMGHIDGTGFIKSIQNKQNSTLYNISVDKELIRYIVKKGSIAIDGISLTVYDLQDDILTVAIIPTTSKETTLSDRKTGDIVNIETDLLAKYIEKMLTHNAGWKEITEKLKSDKGVSEDMLRKYGYL